MYHAIIFRDLATEGGKGEMDAQFAPVLAIQIETELTVSCDSESSMPVEHPEQIDQGYSQNRTAHHPLLISVNLIMH
jgi:aspartyl aminopeptidase